MSRPAEPSQEPAGAVLDPEGPAGPRIPHQGRRAVLGGGLAALVGMAVGGRALAEARPGLSASGGTASASGASARVARSSAAPSTAARSTVTPPTVTPPTVGPPTVGPSTVGRSMVGGPTDAGAATATPPTTAGSVEPLAEPVQQPSQVVAAGTALTVEHVVRRTTYGATTALLADVKRLGPQAWLERQLDPASIPDPVCDGLLARLPDLSRRISETRTAFAGRFGTWAPMHSLLYAHVARAVWSERQLLEVMVDLWSNHLNVTCPSSEVWDSRHDFDRRVIRVHALGRFSDMLVEGITHPAMLRYLTNTSSRAKSPNENLGRELLELHTVGVGAYTEQDVRQSALVLTGLGTDSTTGEFRFRSDWHHVGPVQVMGWSHANATRTGGLDVARDYLRYLATHPRTARTVATKLAVRFVADVPPPALVDRLAAAYLDNDTDITAVLRVLFASEEFRTSSGTKVRRPFEDLVATTRALGCAPPATGIRGLQELYWVAGDLGQSPLGWHPPNGYPDVAAAWTSPSMSLARINMHMNMAGHWWPTKIGVPTATARPDPVPATLGALVDELGRRVLFGPVPAGVRTAVCAFVDGTPSTVLRSWSEAVGWRLPYLVALLLDSPAHAIR